MSAAPAMELSALAEVLTPLQYVKLQQYARLTPHELELAGPELTEYIENRRRRGVPVMGTIQDEVMA